MIILFDVELEYKFNILLLVTLLNFYCYCYNEKNIFMFFVI